MSEQEKIIRTPPTPVKFTFGQPRIAAKKIEAARPPISIPAPEAALIVGCDEGRFISAARSAGVPFDESNPEFSLDEVKQLALPILREGGCTDTLWKFLEQK